MWPFGKAKQSPARDSVSGFTQTLESIEVERILAQCKSTGALLLGQTLETSRSLIALAGFLGYMFPIPGIKPEEIVREQFRNPPIAPNGWIWQAIADEIMRNQAIADDIRRFLDNVYNYNIDKSIGLARNK